MSIGIPPSLPLPDPAPFTPRRFTVEEYHRLGAAGVLDEDDRVELLEGVITPKMMHNPPHDTAITLAEHALRPILPAGWMLRIQSSITTADSEPEPDLVIVRGAPRDFAQQHPVAAQIGLVIEVADSSLLRDRTKGRLYARARIPEYWIINLPEAQVEHYFLPAGKGDAAEYRQSLMFRAGQDVRVNLDGFQYRINVDDLLP